MDNQAIALLLETNGAHKETILEALPLLEINQDSLPLLEVNNNKVDPNNLPPSNKEATIFNLTPLPTPPAARNLVHQHNHQAHLLLEANPLNKEKLPRVHNQVLPPLEAKRGT